MIHIQPCGPMERLHLSTRRKNALIDLARQLDVRGLTPEGKAGIPGWRALVGAVADGHFELVRKTSTPPPVSRGCQED